MKVTEIYFSKKFADQFTALPLKIKKRALKTEQLFRSNSFHPSLRLHKLQGKLKGLWSISIDMKYRIIFKIMSNGEVLFISVGIHSIYQDRESY